MKNLLSMTALALCSALATPAWAQPPAAPLKGEVLETADVSGYTYLRLKTAGGETWAAVPTAKVNKGATVTVVNPMQMKDFQSRALNKSFDTITFGQLEGVAAPGNAGKPGAMPGSMMGSMMGGMAAAPAMPPSPHGGAKAAPAVAQTALVAKVPKAGGADARTVAEVVQGREKLKDKTVSVRGRVTKVNLGIMGKNWLHVQDGSGSLQDGSHDLLVTSQGKAELGDVVTVRGTVRTDVTVGPGYSYGVLVESATLAK